MLNDNQIESIDLSANPELNTLNINNNLLSEIDLSKTRLWPQSIYNLTN